LAGCAGDKTDEPEPVASTKPSSRVQSNAAALNTPMSASASTPAGYISVDGSLIDGNAVAVDLNGLNVDDISELSKLAKIKSLILFDNNISDITALREMTALTELALSENSISDIEPLKNLTNLVTLELDDNDIADITPLAGLHNLKSLNLSGNDNISDISALKELTILDRLYLPNNKFISDTQKSELQAALPNCQIIYGGAMGTRPERQYGANVALYTLPFETFSYTAEQLTDGIWVKRGDKFASLNNKNDLLRPLEEDVVVVTDGDQIVYKSSGLMPDSISLYMYDSVGYKFGFSHNRGTVTQIDSRSNLTKTEISVGNRIVSIDGNTDLDAAYLSLRGDSTAEIKVELGTSEKTISVIPNMEQLYDYAYVSNLDYSKTDSGYVALDMTHIVMSGNYAFSIDGTKSEIFYFQQANPLKETRGKNIWAFLRYANNYTGGVYRADVIVTESTTLYGLSGENAIERSVSQTVPPDTKLHIAGFMITDDDELVAKVVPDNGSDETFALIFDIDKYTLYIHDGVSGWGSDSLHIVNLPFQPRGGDLSPALSSTLAPADGSQTASVVPEFTDPSQNIGESVASGRYAESDYASFKINKGKRVKLDNSVLSILSSTGVIKSYADIADYIIPDTTIVHFEDVQMYVLKSDGNLLSVSEDIGSVNGKQSMPLGSFQEEIQLTNVKSIVYVFPFVYALTNNGELYFDCSWGMAWRSDGGNEYTHMPDGAVIDGHKFFQKVPEYIGSVSALSGAYVTSNSLRSYLGDISHEHFSQFFSIGDLPIYETITGMYIGSESGDNGVYSVSDTQDLYYIWESDEENDKLSFTDLNMKLDFSYGLNCYSGDDCYQYLVEKDGSTYIAIGQTVSKVEGVRFPVHAVNNTILTQNGVVYNWDLLNGTYIGFEHANNIIALAGRYALSTNGDLFFLFDSTQVQIENIVSLINGEIAYAQDNNGNSYYLPKLYNIGKKVISHYYYNDTIGEYVANFAGHNGLYDGNSYVVDLSGSTVEFIEYGKWTKP
jgi:hypothetical protein